MLVEKEMNAVRAAFKKDLEGSSLVKGRMIMGKDLLSVALKRAERASLADLRAMCALLEKEAQERFNALLELLEKKNNRVVHPPVKVVDKEVFHYL